MPKSFSRRIREIPVKIRNNRMNIIAVIVWSLLVTALLIVAYREFFVANAVYYSWWGRHSVVSPPFQTDTGAMAHLSFIELSVISVGSILFGAFLYDVEKVLIGFISTMVISMSLAVAYATDNIWTSLGWGQILSTINGGWSWAVYWGILVVFGEMFPVALALAFFFTLFGAFLRSFISGS